MDGWYLVEGYRGIDEAFHGPSDDWQATRHMSSFDIILCRNLCLVPLPGSNVKRWRSLALKYQFADIYRAEQNTWKLINEFLFEEN